MGSIPVGGATVSCRRNSLQVSGHCRLAYASDATVPHGAVPNQGYDKDALKQSGGCGFRILFLFVEPPVKCIDASVYPFTQTTGN